VHRFMSQKALSNVPDGDDPVAAEDEKTKGSLWSGVSNINFEVTILVASVWVLMLGSAPIMVYKVGGKKVTNSAMILSSLMWLALFGGLFLFTNIILFSSPHFDRVRSLTIVECCYFMTQIITTVGYGDITPALPRGQLFVGVYVTLSFFVIALLVSELQSVVMHKVKTYKKKLQEQRQGYDATHGAVESTSSLGFKPEKPSPNGLFSSLGIFAGVAFVWVLFFHFFPGEDKSWREAIYMCLITLTTVGFGAITPVTEGGMLFGAFMMFIGTSSLVNVVTAFSTYILEMGQYESWRPEEFADGLKKFYNKYSVGEHSSVSSQDFLILTLLQRKMVSEDQIDQIKESYKAMLGSKGKLNLKGIASNVSREINDAELGDSETDAATSLAPSLQASAR